MFLVQDSLVAKVQGHDGIGIARDKETVLMRQQAQQMQIRLENVQKLNGQERFTKINQIIEDFKLKMIAFAAMRCT